MNTQRKGDEWENVVRKHLTIDGSEKLLQLDGDRLTFFQAATSIQDVDKLKKHILAAQREAFELKPYPCIANFYFTDLKLCRVAGYQQLLELGKARKNPIYLEVGCCFGQEIRKAILDGYPQESIIATDVVPEFWDMGHNLFCTTRETFPVPFVVGDAFDAAFLETVPPFSTGPSMEAPKLTDVRTLNDLRGHVSAMSVCAVFHLFDEEKQLQLARALACLLSPEPGSMIIGLHHGLPEKGVLSTYGGMFCHCPESWKAMWDGQVFEKGTVRVHAELVTHAKRLLVDGEPSVSHAPFLEFCITRL